MAVSASSHPEVETLSVVVERDQQPDSGQIETLMARAPLSQSQSPLELRVARTVAISVPAK